MVVLLRIEAVSGIDDGMDNLLTGLPAYETQNLARAVEQLSDARIDALPFGAIRLSKEGIVGY